MKYSIEPSDRIYVNGYGFLSFAKNMAKNLSRFVPTAWHAHNCEWTSSHRILNMSDQNPLVGVSTDDLQ